MNPHVVHLKNLVFSGIHGLTHKEQKRSQKFRLEIKIETDLSGEFKSDDIKDTFDYRPVLKIARRIVEKESYSLIETIAEKIAGEILVDSHVRRVSVSVAKPEIWKIGEPAVTIARENIPAHINLLDFDLNWVVRELCAHGAVSFPVLPDSRRQELLKEAGQYPYKEQPEIVEPAKVREQLSSFKNFGEESLFMKLRDDFTELLLRKAASLSPLPLFTTPLAFNEMSLQLYKRGSIGITPHKDGLSKVNLVCVFILKGKADFALCDDRAGSSPRYLDIARGNVILLRGPGFLGRQYRPFHTITNVTEERLVFGLRQGT